MPHKRSVLERTVRRRRRRATPGLPKLAAYDARLDVYGDVMVRARHLATIYGALRCQVPGARWMAPVTDTSRSFASFLKAAQSIQAWEKASQRRINDIDYIMAHVWYWGKACFTTRLASPSSLALYDAFMRHHTATTIYYDPDLEHAYEVDLLDHLAAVRGESVHDVRESLKDSGLLGGSA